MGSSGRGIPGVAHTFAISGYSSVLQANQPNIGAAFLVLDDFAKRYGEGTMFGNSVVNRYVKDPKFVKNAVGGEEVRRFGEVVGLFRKYGDKYDVDNLLMVAQGFQESGLDHSAKSAVAVSKPTPRAPPVAIIQRVVIMMLNLLNRSEPLEPSEPDCADR